MQASSEVVTGGGTIRFPGLSAAFRLLTLARSVFTLIGVGVVLVVAVPATREGLMQQAEALGRLDQPLADAPTLAAGQIQVSASPQGARERQAVGAFIAKRYRVADEAVAGFVAAAYRAGRQFAVDPLLILAVMAVESGYNPVAESGVGAKGLMQVLPKFHQDKLEAHGGEEALLDPDVNIEVGTQILREYLRRFGETETALQMYAGAMDEPTSQYANKVLAERSRLQLILRRLGPKA